MEVVEYLELIVIQDLFMPEVVLKFLEMILD